MEPLCFCNFNGKWTFYNHYKPKLYKKIVGLAIFQTSVFVFFVSLAKIIDGTAPILNSINNVYSNPLPHVLILTAIVVGVATSALGLAIVLQIYKNYGSVEENEIKKEELKENS